MKKILGIVAVCLVLLGCSEDDKISKVLEKCADQKINFKYTKEVFNDFLYLQEILGEGYLYGGSISFPNTWKLQFQKIEIEKKKQKGEDIKIEEFMLQVKNDKLKSFRKKVDSFAVDYGLNKGSESAKIFLDYFNIATIDLNDFKKSLSRKLNESEEYLKLYKSCEIERSTSPITFDEKNK